MDRELVCPTCGETDRTKFYFRKNRKNTFRCKSCHNQKAIERFQYNKRLAVDYKGGKCSICGYDKCLAALDFHHKDPSQKDPNWRAMKNRKFENIKDELDKCNLVCKNCHAEIHYGE